MTFRAGDGMTALVAGTGPWHYGAILERYIKEMVS